MFYASKGARPHFHCDQRRSVKLYRETRKFAFMIQQARPFYILGGYNLLILVCKTSSRTRFFNEEKERISSNFRTLANLNDVYPDTADSRHVYFEDRKLLSNKKAMIVKLSRNVNVALKWLHYWNYFLLSFPKSNFQLSNQKFAISFSHKLFSGTVCFFPHNEFKGGQ